MPMVFMLRHVQISITSQRSGKESLLPSWPEAEDPISYAAGGGGLMNLLLEDAGCSVKVLRRKGA